MFEMTRREPSQASVESSPWFGESKLVSFDPSIIPIGYRKSKSSAKRQSGIRVFECLHKSISHLISRDYGVSGAGEGRDDGKPLTALP